MTKSKLVGDPYEILERELRILKAQGQVKDLQRGFAGRVMCAEPTLSWADIALSLSLNLPGQFWVGSNSITWQRGNKPEGTLYVVPVARLDAIRDGFAVVQSCTGLPENAIPCTSSGQARKLLQWLNIRQMDARCLDFIGAKDTWSYQWCEPQELAQGYLWDITACYFTLLQRAPSPKVTWLNQRLHWMHITKEERERWTKMLDVSASHKGIRNSFIGQMYACGDGLFYTNGSPNKNADKKIEYLRAADGVTLYQEGLHLDHHRLDERKRPEEKQAQPGVLRPLASLVVRSAYEICGLAREDEKAIYANTDCVITASNTSPAVWGRYGLKVSLKGQGPTSVYAIGYYRVGETQTKHIDAIERKRAQGKNPRVPKAPSVEPNVRATLRGPLWAERWLSSDSQ